MSKSIEEIQAAAQRRDQLAELGARVLEILRHAKVRAHKYADPIEGARYDLTDDEVAEIRAEDPSLIHYSIDLGPIEQAARSLGLLASEADRAGDEARDARATGPDREQSMRGQELDPYRNPESL